jgi:ribosomal protein L21
MEAIIKNGSRQYLVKEGDIVKFDKMNVSPKAKVEFKEILALNDGDFKVGTPYIDGAVVEGEVIEDDHYDIVTKVTTEIGGLDTDNYVVVEIKGEELGTE